MEINPTSHFYPTESESIDQTMSFDLNNECDMEGTPIPGNARWLRLSVEGKMAEGKMFYPATGQSTSLVVFEPGMPGDSVTWMEERFVLKLLEGGYTVFVLRHLGTKVTEETMPYVHCDERLVKAHETANAEIGENREYTLDEIAAEPATVLNAIGDNFEKIDVIGHSAGALHQAYALQFVRPEIAERVHNFIALSGYLGGVEERTQNFHNLQGYYEYCSAYINMGDPAENVKQVQAIFASVADHGIPEHIMPILVNSPKDEYIPISGAQKFHEMIGRGLQIVDQTQYEERYHDLRNLQPETLLKLLSMHYPKSKHTIEVSHGRPNIRP